MDVQQNLTLLCLCHRLGSSWSLLGWTLTCAAKGKFLTLTSHRDYENLPTGHQITKALKTMVVKGQPQISPSILVTPARVGMPLLGVGWTFPWGCSHPDTLVELQGWGTHPMRVYAAPSWQAQMGLQAGNSYMSLSLPVREAYRSFMCKLQEALRKKFSL